MSPRLGLMGGTFDPVHEGHVDLARTVAATLDLAAVHLLTNRRPPHKAAAEAAEHHRHAMVALATAPHGGLVADPRELIRPGPSYTIDTLEELRRERPGAELFFLGGEDSLRELSTWRRWGEILEACTFVAVGRAGRRAREAVAALPAEARRDRVRLLDHEPPPWSSSEIRRRLRVGESCDAAVPAPVLDYARKNRLYGLSGGTGE